MRNKVCKQLRRLAEAHTTGQDKQHTRALYQRYKQDYRTREFLNAPSVPTIEQQLNTTTLLTV